ncbi:MAG: magnesium/cobalt transporter CorA [Deltaproteobacteria bacterium]|nr:magnesium/cobalt transporter CorA [Deltaproteobacteria bacterium]
MDKRSHLPKLVKKRSRKAGLAPGTPVHIGKEKTGRIRVTAYLFDETGFEEREIKAVEECIAFKGGKGVAWIRVSGIHDIDSLERLGATFGLHALVLEDIVNTAQRPKKEDYGDYIYIVLKAMHQGDLNGEVFIEQVSIVVWEGLVISFEEGHTDLFGQLVERIKKSRERFARLGHDYLAYSLMDTVVDNYFAILERLGDGIDGLEDELVGQPTPDTLAKIRAFKNEIVFLLKTLWPLRELISGLERGESKFMGEHVRLYLRDVYDHTIEIIETVETLREMVSGMIDIYLSSTNFRTGEIMKVLTVIATIFMPLTFIVGIYGMNFRYMPELERPWAYPMLLVSMLLAGLSMVFWFKRKGWF